MKNFSNYFRVYESKCIYFSEEELNEYGYGGIDSKLLSACELAISKKTKVYLSRIQAYDVKPLRSINAFEVHYYHIHCFNTTYLDGLIYNFYKQSGLKVKSVYVTSDNGICINFSLCTDIIDVNEISDLVNIQELYVKVKEYVTINLSISCEVCLNKASDVVLRFKSWTKIQKRSKAPFLCDIYWSFYPICYNYLNRRAYEYF